MVWKTEAERKMLERILALLVSFAGLCDRAARLPALLRWPAVAILRCAERVLHPFVWDLACEAGRPVYVDELASLIDNNAERLAASFRALALTLDELLAWAQHPARSFALRAARPVAGSTPSLCRSAGPHDRWLSRPLAPDTS